MGSIAGSGVANVAATGVFSISLMRRAGYSCKMVGAIEAVASTGRQLMPPVMGAAAFVMAEVLQADYGRIALAELIPVAVFPLVDLRARKTGAGTSPNQDLNPQQPLARRPHLLNPPGDPCRHVRYGSLSNLCGCDRQPELPRRLQFPPSKEVELTESSWPRGGAHQTIHLSGRAHSGDRNHDGCGDSVQLGLKVQHATDG